MSGSIVRRILCLTLAACCCSAESNAQAPNFVPAKSVKIKPEDRERFEKALKELDELFQKVHTPELARGGGLPAGWADAEIGRKALRWILKYDEFYTPKFVGMTEKVVSLTHERLKTLESQAKLKPGFGTVLGYISSVDGSVQPYALYLPPDANEKPPSGLLVVLHGRNQTLNEVSFIDAHEGKPYPKNEIENGMRRAVLHVYGRTNNAYRWAGERDVFEAFNDCVVPKEIESRLRLKEPLKVDLQGFSMGGAGAWHLGLHHPDHWRTVEAGAGFNETVHYAKLKNSPPWIAKTLHLYDAFEVARNITGVPTIGYGGENDPQLTASKNVMNQLSKEGFRLKTEGLVTSSEELPFLQVVGAKMGHKVDEASRKTMDEFVDAQKEIHPIYKRNHGKIDRVTYSLKYPEMSWIHLVKLQEHYKRTWVQAEVSNDGTAATISRLDNVSMFSILDGKLKTVKIFKQTFTLKGPNQPHFFVLRGADWLYFTGEDAVKEQIKVRKQPGLHGPIDDAFTSGFVVIGPEGDEKSVEKQRMDEFAATWSKYMRGDLPMAKAADVANEDPFRNAYRHLILFGTPRDNPLIAKVLPKIKQVRWTDSEFTLGGKTYSNKEYIPTLIAPDPLNGARYVVINSGHTFGRKDFEGTNALLYPRMGDWGVLKKKADGTTEIVDSGFFDEDWNP